MKSWRLSFVVVLACGGGQANTNVSTVEVASPDCETLNVFDTPATERALADRGVPVARTLQLVSAEGGEPYSEDRVRIHIGLDQQELYIPEHDKRYVMPGAPDERT